MSNLDQKQLPGLLDYTQKHWETWPGLLMALLIALIGSLSLTTFLPKPVVAVLFVVIEAMLTTVWFWMRRLPKTKRGKVGLVICISAEEKGERTRIKEDFVRSLHELLKRGQSGQYFQVITVPDRIAPHIVDTDDAEKIVTKCKAHFILFGRARLRTINSSEQHVLNLTGLVKHRPIPKEVSAQFSGEISELLPTKILVNKQNDFKNFEFTSELVNCVAKYIIGVAAAMSGDLAYAEQLQNDVLSAVSAREGDFPIYKKLRDRVPFRLAEIHHQQAVVSYDRWLKNRDILHMDQMGIYLQRIPRQYENRYPVLILRAILAFVRDRDTAAAKGFIDKCEKVAGTDGTWLFSRAFVEAYEGDLKTASRCYQKAMEMEIGSHLVSDVEEFLSWVFEQEPDKVQLLFCLGYINERIKDDGKLAVEHFSEFLDKCDRNCFPDERKHAAKSIVKLKKMIEGQTAPPQPSMPRRSDGENSRDGKGKRLPLKTKGQRKDNAKRIVKR
ncbi:hypothetical protein HQ520_19160 [bacterium]|nr:hypothetical protein [bacterium]